jgi:hypothetical protein
MPLWGDDFKPIQGDFGLTAKAACDHTKRPEVNVRDPLPAPRKAA